MRASYRPQPDSICRGQRGGQALLVAVLLMLAILLVGILFVAIVSYNQSQSARHEDMVVAQGLSEWGIRFADEMLQTSVLGADWRPPLPPALYADGTHDADLEGPDGMFGTEDDYYTDDEIARGWAPLREGTVAAPGAYIRWGYTRYPDTRQPAGTTAMENNDFLGRGYFLLRITYDPDPPYEGDEPRVPNPLSRHVRIESIGRVVDMGNVFRRLEAYKPLGLVDYARFVTDATDTGNPARLGAPAWMNLDNDGMMDGPVDASADISDPASTPLEWVGTTFNGPIKVNTVLEVYGSYYDFTGGNPPPDPRLSSTAFMLTTGESSQGYLRDDAVEASSGIEVATDCDDGVGVYVDAAAEVKVRSSSDPAYDAANGRLRDGREDAERFSSALAAPELTLSAEEVGMERYRKLSRDSGTLVDVGAPGSETYVNNGEWGHGAGIYVDNHDDVQFMQADGDHDLTTLLDDWQRPMAAGGTPPPDSGWNATMTTYSPPGVEVQFYPTAAAVGSYSATLPVASGEVWWPNHDAINNPPGVRLTRHDRTWRTDTGTDSGQYTMVVDYPTMWFDGTDTTQRNPVIFAEGNIRVSGQLPRALRAAPGGGNQLRRAYDMTVVSNGTIYIDGELLCPQDQFGRQESATGYDATVAGSAVVDEDNTMVALLARDCVCLNITQVVPQLTTGMVSAAPDDPANLNDPNRHWELSSGVAGTCYSTWAWGADAPAGGTVNVVAYQTAGDPGPSGMSLTIWDGAYSPYVFGAPPAPLLDTTFLFVPPATVIPGEAGPAPYQYASTTLAPLWEEHSAATPLLPWDITGYIASMNAGDRAGVIFKHEDPVLGAGSTDYWLKRWKIEQLNSDGRPVGAIQTRVNAAVYAERGCWYVLAPDYFNEDITSDGTPAQDRLTQRFRRYNYAVEFTGMIAENFTAPLESVRGWMDRAAYPNAYTAGGNLSQWGTVQYNFAESLRIVRDQGLTSLAAVNTPPRATAITYYPATAEANLPKLPLLPVSPDLIYSGEAQ